MLQRCQGVLLWCWGRQNSEQGKGIQSLSCIIHSFYNHWCQQLSVGTISSLQSRGLRGSPSYNQDAPKPTPCCCSPTRPPQIPRPGDQCVLQAVPILLTLHSHNSNISLFKMTSFLLSDWWPSTGYGAWRKVASWDTTAAANPARACSTKDYAARSPKPRSTCPPSVSSQLQQGRSIIQKSEPVFQSTQLPEVLGQWLLSGIGVVKVPHVELFCLVSWGKH